jgi:hypothetical protein
MEQANSLTNAGISVANQGSAFTAGAMMRKMPLLVATILLSACATATQTYGPDGRPAYSLNCSGAALSWGECESKAGNICGTHGYTVVTRSSDQNSTIGAGAGGLFGSSGNSRSMTIQCKS